MLKKKIVDAFLFGGEKDIFCARINYLKNSVNYFLAIESNSTFTGNKKDLTLKNIINLNFPDIKDRIFVYENKQKILNIKDLIRINYYPFKKDSPNIKTILRKYKEQKVKSYIALNEGFQRELINHAIKKLHLKESDILLISDLDEIPSKTFIKKASIIEKDFIFYAHMNQYLFNTEFSLKEKWIGTVALRSNLLKTNSVHNLRFMLKEFNKKTLPYKLIPNSGWHLTSFGNIKQIQKKISSWGHQELNTIINRNLLRYRVRRGFDIFSRNKIIKFEKTNRDIPSNIRKFFNKEDYFINYIKPNLFDKIFNFIASLLDKIIRKISLYFQKI